MAFKTPQYELDRVTKAIAAQFPPEERAEIASVLEPFLAQGSRVPLCILHLARGRKEDVVRYAERAERDFRDVIYWAENPDEAALNTPEKIEDFQQLLESCGQPRDPSLDEEKCKQQKERDSRSNESENS